MLTIILSTITTLLTSPIGVPIGELLIALVGFILQKGNFSAATHGQFLSWVQQAEAAGSIPAGLYAKYASLLKSVDDKIDAELAKEKAAKEPGAQK